MGKILFLYKKEQEGLKMLLHLSTHRQKFVDLQKPKLNIKTFQGMYNKVLVNCKQAYFHGYRMLNHVYFLDKLLISLVISIQHKTVHLKKILQFFIQITPV